MKIAIIPGHGWRPHPTQRGIVRWDPGAVADDRTEAAIVRAVAARALAVRPAAISVHDAAGQSGPGTLYRERHAAAVAALGSAGGLVLHLHVNAGGGRYAACFHDPRSKRGAAAARSMASAIEVAAKGRPSLAELTLCKVLACNRPDWDKVANLVEPGWSAPANVCSILVELGFIDQPDHDGLWALAGLDALAAVIVSQAG